MGLETDPMTTASTALLLQRWSRWKLPAPPCSPAATRRSEAQSIPWGDSGLESRLASRYWGLTVPEYYEASGLWPLDPDGEIIPHNHLRISQAVQNSPRHSSRGADRGVLAGPGDLSVTMGSFAGNPQGDVQEALLSILNTSSNSAYPAAPWLTPRRIRPSDKEQLPILHNVIPTPKPHPGTRPEHHPK